MILLVSMKTFPIFGTGVGDGVYPVFIATNTDGKAITVKVGFLEDDLEEWDYDDEEKGYEDDEW